MAEAATVTDLDERRSVWILTRTVCDVCCTDVLIILQKNWAGLLECPECGRWSLGVVEREDEPLPLPTLKEIVAEAIASHKKEKQNGR